MITVTTQGEISRVKELENFVFSLFFTHNVSMMYLGMVERDKLTFYRPVQALQVIYNVKESVQVSSNFYYIGRSM